MSTTQRFLKKSHSFFSHIEVSYIVVHAFPLYPKGGIVGQEAGVMKTLTGGRGQVGVLQVIDSQLEDLRLVQSGDTSRLHDKPTTQC